jgi:hypothetical protein
MKYDWKEIEDSFLKTGHESRITLKDISERFEVPYQSLRRHAAKKEWHNKRYRAWINERYKTS